MVVVRAFCRPAAVRGPCVLNGRSDTSGHHSRKGSIKGLSGRVGEESSEPRQDTGQDGRWGDSAVTARKAPEVTVDDGRENG